METGPGAPYIGGWVDLRAGLDAVLKEKNHFLLPGIEPYSPVVQPVTQSH
jgi:hypothetical protein